MFNRKQIIALLMIRNQPGNLFSSLPKSISDYFVESCNIEEKAGKYVKTFSEELFDIANLYLNNTKFLIFETREFRYQARGLKRMLEHIADDDKLNNSKKLMLLIQLTQKLQCYLSGRKSVLFLELLHGFMSNHGLSTENIPGCALSTLIERMPLNRCVTFYSYFTGGCHIFYPDSKAFFLTVSSSHDWFFDPDKFYQCNNQKYTLEQLVENFLLDQHNEIWKCNQQTARAEYDAEEFVVGMHGVL
jgi:hypothetical protein